MQKRNVLIAILVALAMPFAIQAKGGQQKALAETEPTVKTTALTVEKQKEQTGAKKCETIQNRLETKITRFENSKQRDQRVFGNLKSRFDRLANRLGSTGADTSKLKTDLATLYSKIDKLMADHDVFLSDLTATKETSCSITATEMKTKVGEARKVATTIRQDRLDIRNFFLTTLKADLMEIRKALPEKPETQASETETETPKAGRLKKTPTTTETTTTTTPTTTTSTTTTTQQ
jgi:hypothetical protein